MTSPKKLIAVLAVSLPLAASAQQAAAPAAAAPAPLYQIYGTLNVNGQYIEVSKPTAGITGVTPINMSGRFAISTDSTNIGIKGVADTGQFGLGVVYQCETSAAVDGDTASGICNRNSRLGLSGGFGTIFYGNWDTPLKAAAYGTKADDPFGNTDVYDAAAIIGSPGSKTRSNAGRTNGTAGPQGSFNIRAANSIAYHSPKFEGLQVKAQYSVNEYQNSHGDLAPALYSVGANFDRGPLSVFAAYERHDDWFAANLSGLPATSNRTTRDYGIKAGAGFELATGASVTTIGVQADYLNIAVTHPATGTGNFDKANRWAYMVGLKHRMGDHELRLRWSQALDADITITGVTPSPNPGKDTGASNWAAGYAYYLSKAAQVYVYATMIDNKKFASYTFATAGPAQLSTTTAAEAWTIGADPFAAGIGMRYAF